LGLASTADCLCGAEIFFEAALKLTAAERATILRRHLADKIAVSDLCDEYKIQPSLFYVWQRQLMENMAAALQAPNIVF